MDREPSAHSMTVETTDRENLAEKVFLLERWQAKAVQTISQLEGERDEALRAIEAARREITHLDAVADEVAGQAVRDVRELTDKLHKAVAERDRLNAENAKLMESHAALTKEWDLDSDVADRRFNTMKAVVEAVINAI